MKGVTCIPAGDCPCAYHGRYYTTNSTVATDCKTWHVLSMFL